MSEPKENTKKQVEALIEFASDIARVLRSLPPEEREAYEDAQKSIIEARRSAEVHEGLLQLC